MLEVLNKKWLKFFFLEREFLNICFFGGYFSTTVYSLESMNMIFESIRMIHNIWAYYAVCKKHLQRHENKIQINLKKYARVKQKSFDCFIFVYIFSTLYSK